MVLYLLLALLLILLNAFFVLAEFAAVKSQADADRGPCGGGEQTRAKIMERIQAHLDEYLSVCQVGITLASIGLGFVGEPAFASSFFPLSNGSGSGGWPQQSRHMGLPWLSAYLLVSFLHIVLGELVPKSVAIRRTEKAALFTAFPMVVFRYVFIAPIWLLNSTVNGILRALPSAAGDRPRRPFRGGDQDHSRPVAVQRNALLPPSPAHRERPGHGDTDRAKRHAGPAARPVPQPGRIPRGE